jgi:hypothetical protein
MKTLQILLLKWRCTVLDAQIANGEALLQDHAERLKIAKAELHRAEMRLNTLERPSNLLKAALERK